MTYFRNIMFSTKREINEKVTRLMLVKQAVFAFNLILAIEATISFSYGVYFLIYRKFSGNMRRIEKYDDSSTSEVIVIGSWILIFCACLVALIAVIGAMSVIKENLAGLITYTSLLLISFGILMACGIWGSIQVDYLKGTVSDGLGTLFKKAFQEGDLHAEYAVRRIQKSLKCCGNVGPSDYGGDLPPSCYFYKKGCNGKFFSYYRSHLLSVTVSSYLFAGFQVLGIALSIYLAKELRIALKIVDTKKKYILNHIKENSFLLKNIGSSSAI